MMRELEDLPAYVLHARAYRESSLLLELLVLGHGRLGAVARAARGPRSSARRALLQPLQPLHVSLLRRGELYTLTRCEAASQPLRLQGQALLAALYVNELCQRLLPREEPVDPLFARYAGCMATLAAGGVVADTLRQLELRLLEVSGYAIDLRCDARKQSLRAEARYWLSAHGELEEVPTLQRPSVAGVALRALEEDAVLPATESLGLRQLLRTRILHALGGRELRCWGLLDELAALGAVATQAQASLESSASQARSKA
jgi:DNA repair protein RecO (recombination protein O)